MKKIIILLLSIFCIGYTVSALESVNATGEKNTVRVTEKVPGIECKEVEGTKKTGLTLYDCEVEDGLGGIQKGLLGVIKYFTFIAGLASVLTLVIGGIMYSMGGADEQLKTKSKELIKQSLLGLILLMLSGSILYAVAPWIFVK